MLLGDVVGVGDAAEVASPEAKAGAADESCAASHEKRIGIVQTSERGWKRSWIP